MLAIKRLLAPTLIQRYFSQGRRDRLRRRVEKKRVRQGKAHQVTVYLRINDAYSYVLLQVLEDLQQRLDIEYEFRTVLSLQADMYPAPELWNKNAFDDGQYFSELYAGEIDFPANAPSSSDAEDAALTAQLLHWELQPNYLQNALSLFKAYWNNDEEGLLRLTDARVTKNFECYQHHL
ncbi:MAG: disulfide bond formation protein DsbA, partial [Pseudomonadota bacterium]